MVQLAILGFITERLRVDEMIRHSLIMVIFSILVGLGNYLYQLTMGIILTAEQYSVLFSLHSLLLIIMVFCRTISTTIAKITSKLKAEGKPGGVNYLWKASLKRTLLFGTVAFALVTALSPIISRFLNIDNIFYTIVLFSTMLVVLVLFVNWGTMQGLQRFMLLGSTQALQAFLKLGFGVLLVYLGFGILGGLAAIPISFAVVLFFTIFSLRNLSGARNEKVKVTGIGSYTGLTLLAIFSLTMLTNVDVVLARHYLNATDAGNYSAISVLGRVAFYAPIGVAVAMFPKTSELYETGGNYRGLFLKAMLLTLLIASGVALVYGLFPQSITQFIFGAKYPSAATYLFAYGLAMGLFALSFVVMRYFLSINRTIVAYPLLGVMLLQLGLIAIFHSNIAQLVNIMLVCSIVCIVSMLPFYLRSGRQALK